MRIKPNTSGSNQSKQAGVLQNTGIMGGCRTGEHGFTLLEMMIVMIIMAVMTAIAIPAFSSWREKQAVRNAAQALMAQMKQARVLAVSDNRSVSITFTSTNYTFDADTTGSCSTCKKETYNLGQYSGNLTISSNKNPVSFSSRGTSGNATITLTASAYSKKIRVNIIGRAYLL